MKNVNVIKFMMLLLGFSLVLYEGQAMKLSITSKSEALDSKRSVGTSQAPQVCKECSRMSSVMRSIKHLSPQFYVAISHGHIDCVRALIASGTNVNLQDIVGSRPLHSAVYHGHLDVVRELIAADADVNSRDNLGATPLHGAACHGRTQYVQMLIEAMAQVNLKNQDGLTAILCGAQWARRSKENQSDALRLHGCKNCIKLLLHAGAEPKLGQVILANGEVATLPRLITERAQEQAIVDECVAELQVDITKKQQNVLNNLKTVSTLEHFPPGVLSIIASFEGLEIAEIVNDAAPTSSSSAAPAV